MGGDCPCLPSGHGLDTVGPNEEWMRLNCGAGVVRGVPRCSDPSLTEGGDLLVSGGDLLPKEATTQDMGKMVGKWEASSRLTLFAHP